MTEWLWWMASEPYRLVPAWLGVGYVFLVLGTYLDGKLFDWDSPIPVLTVVLGPLAPVIYGGVLLFIYVLHFLVIPVQYARALGEARRHRYELRKHTRMHDALRDRKS